MLDHPADLGLLLFRVVVGVVLLAHGWNHVFGGGKIAGTARWFESLGMRPGLLHAWTASVTELGAGTLLVLGLLTPFAGGAVIGVLLVAWVTNHAGNGFFIFRPGEGYEYVLVLVACGVLLACTGGGAVSLDHALNVFDGPGWRSASLALAAGFGGAALTLGAFWRPPAKTPA
ncbi:MAG: putative rane protein [Frankiales bacterium]|nr:putative rane protein [Frankiales bacterium]MCW2586348.1 putative rane protein [Frankiales bacterium]